MDSRVFVSLGILKVGAILEQAGIAVDHIDLSGVANYVEAAKDYQGDADCYAFTATTPQIPAAMDVLRVLKGRGKTILGGPHATLVHAAAKRGNKRAKEALDQLLAEFDCVVAGDGEKAVFTALHSRGLIDADDPASILWQTSKDFTESPWPARHLVDFDSYHYAVDGKRATSAIFQLGCPFECGFCGGRLSPMLRRIRSRSTDNIIAEMQHLHDKHGIDSLMCYDNKTEILTRRGFIKFPELLPSDEVAVLDHSRGEMQFEIPLRQVSFHYKGRMISFRNRSMDLCVTPEHGMWVDIGRGYQRLMASEVEALDTPLHFLQRAEWKGTEVRTFSIPAYNARFLGRTKGSPKVLDGVRTFPADVWIKFMAWYLSEGSSCRTKIAKGGLGYRICIKQDNLANPHKVQEIRAVLNELGYRYSYSSNQFHIDSKELYEYLHPFGTSHHKYVPEEFKLMSKRLIRLFVDTYLKGDGTCSKSGQKAIMSASKRMRDDLQEMVIKGGEWAFANDNRKRVQIAQQKDLIVNSEHGDGGQIRDSEYDGEVHCVTVSTGVVLVRRNGKAVWCGNCYDDELNVNKGLVDLMRRIKGMGIDWRLRGFVKSELFNEEQAEVMYDAGFRWLLCGFESGHPKILKNINKKATREDNSKMLRTAHKYGLKVKALMSIGHPGESEETINATKEWLLEEKPDDFDASVITLYPGTPYWDNSVNVAGSLYRYEVNGDALYSEDVDFMKELAYYKGHAGEYKAFVWTDYISRERIVQMRDELEQEVRTKLGIPYPTAAAAIAFEHSMGMNLPPSILRSSK